MELQSPGRTHSILLHPLLHPSCCPAEPARRWRVQRNQREQPKRPLAPAEPSVLGGMCHSEWCGLVPVTRCQAAGWGKIPVGRAASPETDGRSECKESEDRQQGSGRAMHSGLPMSNRELVIALRWPGSTQTGIYTFQQQQEKEEDVELSGSTKNVTGEQSAFTAREKVKKHKEPRLSGR
ncbi:unnamed protein product [Pleuronectes platessa]|uniref:Uncharacterized protein n=1 Tax=Pleuronectes platessa TaxID=8262 RepID=A0A9N7Z1C6_PLEPL|nr:unnamed protein product [Pleuronectes platessa]